MRLVSRRRSREQGSEPPIFSDAHSMGGEENGTPSTSTTTFSARIIVSDGSSNPCVSGEVPQESPAVDTTLRLEECSDCSSEGGGNELVVITSAVIEPDPEDVEAAPVVDEESLSQQAKHEIAGKDPSFKGSKGKFVYLCIFVVLLVSLVSAGVVAAVKLLPIDDDDKLDEGEFLEEEASSYQIGTYPSPSPSVASNSTLELEDLELFEVISDPSYSPTPTPNPTVAPSNKPSPEPTIAPSAIQTSILTFLPTQLSTAPDTPSKIETLAPTEATTTLGSTDIARNTTSLATNETLRFHIN